MRQDRTISNFVIKADAGTLKELSGLLSRFLSDSWKAKGIESEEISILSEHTWDKQEEVKINLSKAGVEYVFDNLMSARQS
jgi:hypothetical protein